MYLNSSKLSTRVAGAGWGGGGESGGRCHSLSEALAPRARYAATGPVNLGSASLPVVTPVFPLWPYCGGGPGWPPLRTSSPDQLGPASRSRGVPCPCAVPGAAARPSSQLWPSVRQAPRRERRARETRRCVPGSGRRRTRGRRRGRQHRCISANDRGPPRGTAASCRGARGPALRLPAPLCQGPSNRKISLGLLMRSWEN